jgi:two-component system response regulator NreC
MDEGVVSLRATESSHSHQTITVVLADDHQIVRDGIRLILESELDIDVVAEAGDGEAAARYVLGHNPTILLLDLNMPGRSSLELIPTIGEISPKTRTIVLTMQNEPDFARRAFAAGARGYVLKQSASAELVEAIRLVLGGSTYTSPELGARMATEPQPSDEPPGGLTPRELEVLRLLGHGYMNPEVAEQLVLSVRTVETHRANIQRKTGCQTRAELIAYAREHGLA